MPSLKRPSESERAFQRAVLELAQWCGYLTYHTRRSDGSEPGYPDWTFAKGGRPLLLVELKSETGLVTPAQQDWLEVLRQTTGIRAECWRPSSWSHIEALIKHGMP